MEVWFQSRQLAPSNRRHRRRLSLQFYRDLSGYGYPYDERGLVHSFACLKCIIKPFPKFYICKAGIPLPQSKDNPSCSLYPVVPSYSNVSGYL